MGVEILRWKSSIEGQGLRILFDGDVFSWQDRGGISRYGVELARALARLGHNPTIMAPIHVNQDLRMAGVEVRVVGMYLPRIPHTWKMRLDLHRRLESLLFRHMKADVVHQLHIRDEFSQGTAPRVITIHDLIPERHPEQFPDIQNFLRIRGVSLRRADAIICVSDATKLDLARFYPSLQVPIHVVKHGCANLPNPVEPSVRPSKPFFLYVGDRRAPYKNFAGILKAFASLQPQIVADLVVFGGGYFSNPETTLMENMGVDSSRVRKLSGSDAVLHWLYQNALALVYPSVIEGFGLPVLEAMWHSCPVVCANASCLPEVAGDAALLFDSASEVDLAKAMLTMASNSELREQFISKGRIRSSGFTWENCARQTAEIYKDLLAI